MAERKNGSKGSGKGGKGSGKGGGSAHGGGGHKGGVGEGGQGGQGQTEQGSAPAWTSKHLWQIQPVRDVLLFAAIFGLLALGYKLSIVTVPLLLGLTFAYLFEPVVERLTKGGKITRQGASGGIIAAFVIVIGAPVTIGVGFGIVQAISAAQSLKANVIHVDTLMEYAKALNNQDDVDGSWEIAETTGIINFLPDDAAVTFAQGEITQPEAEVAYREMGDTYKWWCRYDLTSNIGLDRAGDVAGEQGGDEAGTTAKGSLLFSAVGIVRDYVKGNPDVIADKAVGRGVGAASAALRTVTSLGMILFMAFLTAFFFFFISSSYGRVIAFLRTLLPSNRKERYLDLLGQMDAVIAGFIRGRITIAFIQSFVFMVAYAVIGVPMPLVLGPLVAILSIVPYLALIGVPISIVLMFLDSSGGAAAGVAGLRDQTWWMIVMPTVVYFAGQALDDYVWTPRIQGKATGMDTPSILFASIAGGALMGVYGLLLAIPVAACLKILLREVFWPRFKAWSDGKEKDFLPFGRGGE